MSTPEKNKPNTGRAEILSLERHGALRFHKAANFAFATDWLFVPVHYKEASNLATQFPVLFYPLPDGSVMPCMLMKSEGMSALNEQLAWRGRYIPDVIRLYPFGFSDNKGRNSLMVYPEAPHFEGKGEKIITSKGKPTQKLNRIIKQLGPVQKAFDDTRQVMKELVELNILQPAVYSVALPNGQRTRMKLLCCPDKSVIKNQSLSARLRTLLYVHQQSCRRIFAQADVVSGSKLSNTNTEAQSVSAQDDVSSIDLNALIKSVCTRFDVSLDDLRSRKRSEPIKNARAALAAEANAGDCMPELAIQLERSVDTVKKWL